MADGLWLPEMAGVGQSLLALYITRNNGRNLSETLAEISLALCVSFPSMFLLALVVQTENASLP